MLGQITLENFKCFGDKTEFNLAPITIMYSRNGRGKSTMVQSLLLLAQTMVNSNDISNLQLAGQYADLGSFDDLVNRFRGAVSFGITLRGDDGETVEMEFAKKSDNIQTAQVTVLNVNGETRFNEIGGKDSSTGSGTKTVGTTSDIRTLQMLKTVKYVSAGRLGPQNSFKRKDSLDEDNLGINGENVINVLSRKGPRFLTNVENTLSYVLGGASIRIHFKDTENIELYLNSKDGNDTFRPVNVGFGYSHILPVVVAAHIARKGSLLIIENPEAHLHPSAQSRIMKFLIEVAKEKNLQLIIETHSDHVVNGMRIAMKEGSLEENDAHVLYFSDGRLPVEVIKCDRNGTLSDNPDDFLDEWTLQLLKLV